MGKIADMTRLFFILMIGVSLALSGCSFLPFFSSIETVRNPVPKPEAEQADLNSEAKSVKDGAKERTPSLVLLPENRRNINAVAPPPRKVTHTIGNPVFTGLDRCLSTGYSLLDGIDCIVTSEDFNEATPVADFQNSVPTALDSDLLGNGAVKQPIEKLAEVDVRQKKEVGMTETSSNDRSNASEVPIASAASSPIHAPPPSDQARLIPASYERIVLSSDIFFEFAKFKLDGTSEDGQLALRGLLERFAKYDMMSLRKVIITGHSDRLGKQSINLTLSEQRAFSIKAFLINAGIDADILETAGVGAASPVKHCVGEAKRAKLKSCLAPNRRVEIEIIGAT